MKLSLKIGIVLFFCLIGKCQAQGWRGIVPLHSTCEDVKRVFNTTTCESGLIYIEDASVFITFSDGTCRSEWDVPRGTVIALDVRPKHRLTVEDLHLDLTTYTRTADQQVQGTLYLNNKDEGISIAAFEDGRVRHVFYGPTLKENFKRCDSRPVESADTGHGSVKFDAYRFGPFSDNTSRLDKFATTLAGWVGASGYIIVYPGQGAGIQDVQIYANQAKKYLLKKKGISNDRIVSITGGFRDEPSVELFITVKGGSPPTPSPQRAYTNPRPSVQETGRDAIYSRFEEYDADTPQDKVQELLDAFAQLLKSNPPLKAFLISYGGKHSCRNEALQRARLATRYLSNTHGISSSRSAILDGGYREDWVMELWVGSLGATPPSPTRTISMKQVMIRGNCKFTALDASR